MLLRTSLIIIFAICLVNMYFFFLTFLNQKSIIYAPRCFRIQIRIKRSALLNIRRKKKPLHIERGASVLIGGLHGISI